MVGMKSIDTVTLRKLMPMWLRAAGFKIDDRDARLGFVTVYAGEHSVRQIGWWFGKVLGQLRVTDGEVLYRADENGGFVQVKMKREGYYEEDE